MSEKLIRISAEKSVQSVRGLSPRGRWCPALGADVVLLRSSPGPSLKYLRHVHDASGSPRPSQQRVTSPTNSETQWPFVSSLLWNATVVGADELRLKWTDRVETLKSRPFCGLKSRPLAEAQLRGGRAGAVTQTASPK